MPTYHLIMQPCAGLVTPFPPGPVANRPLISPQLSEGLSLTRPTRRWSSAGVHRARVCTAARPIRGGTGGPACGAWPATAPSSTAAVAAVGMGSHVGRVRVALLVRWVSVLSLGEVADPAEADDAEVAALGRRFDFGRAAFEGGRC